MLRDLKLDGATNLHNHGRMGRLSEALSVLDRALIIEEQVAGLKDQVQLLQFTVNPP